MKALEINDLCIGNGVPKICIPVVANDIEGAKEQAANIAYYNPDIVEVRGDYFDDPFNEENVAQIIECVKELVNVPIIFTFRTSKEGGEKPITDDEYRNLLTFVAEKTEAEIIDVQVFENQDVVKNIVNAAHSNNKFIIFSNHDFDKTPEYDDILLRLKKMEEMGGDIAKIAVMPKSKMDVFTLLMAGTKATEDLNIPVVTMSMSRLGVMSRICGEAFGSAITFGTAGKASAPGQISAIELREIMELMHNQL